MSRYLLVLHEFDDSEALVATARRLAATDRTAEFVLLTPTAATALDLLLEPSGSALRVARRRAEKARGQLLSAGLSLEAARMGNFDPFRAVEDALRFSSYSAVVVGAPSHPILHFIHFDLCCRLARRFPNAVFIHATAHNTEPESTAAGASNGVV